MQAIVSNDSMALRDSLTFSSPTKTGHISGETIRPIDADSKHAYYMELQMQHDADDRQV